MGRSPCCEKAHTNKGAWTKDEDHRLVDYIRRHGEGCWRSLPKSAGLLRCGKSCRLRWINYLRPDLKRGNFSADEDELIIKLHAVLGNKWSLIAGRLPGRTDNEIKNYWNTHIKRKLIGRGVDPQTHRPIDGPAGAAAVKAIKLDFRSAAGAPPDPMAETPKWVEPDSGEDVNCSSSGVTTDEEPPPPAAAAAGRRSRRPESGLNLELSIGPAGSSPRGDSRGRGELGGVGAEAVCLCCRLGFRGGEVCGNCGSRNGYYRYCNYKS